MSSTCTTLRQDLDRLKKERENAHIKAAVRNTLQTISGENFCPLGHGADWRLSIDLNNYFTRSNQEWVLLGPRVAGITEAEHVLDSLVQLLPRDAHHFWLTPYYYELGRKITFFPQSGTKHDPLALHRMCQPWYWEGEFMGNTGEYRRPHTMTLKAAYTFPLQKEDAVELRIANVAPPIAIIMDVNICMWACGFPGLDLSHKIASPAGRKVYGYWANLRGWDVIRWRGGWSQHGVYPDPKQTFWNACAE